MTLTLGMITIDCAEPRKLAEFWTAAMDLRIDSDYEGEFMVLAPKEGGGVNIGLQKVPGPRRGKNSVHIDFGSEDRAAEVERLIGLGATQVAEHEMPGFGWTVLADPEGNVFDVGQATG